MPRFRQSSCVYECQASRKDAIRLALTPTGTQSSAEAGLDREEYRARDGQQNINRLVIARRSRA
jgi:hypothetical protein